MTHKDVHGLPPDLTSILRKKETTAGEALSAHVRLAYEQHKTQSDIYRFLCERTTFVDEWQQGGVPVSGIIQLQPDYGTEVITDAFVSLPIGVTTANLCLGERTIPLYSGVATTSQTVVNLNGFTILLNETDYRYLKITGATTTPFYINLMGYLLKR